MRKLTVFIQLSVDGYFADAKGDVSWAHKSDPEWKAFAAGNATSGGELLFGRITYEMMAGYWPTPRARADNAAVADGMNQLPKVVFSRTLDHVSWANTRLVKGHLAEEVRRMKTEPGMDMTILGSGSIVSQLAPERLVDEFQIIMVPVVLGDGRKLFDGVKEKLPLKLTNSRTFSNGNVVLSYAHR